MEQSQASLFETKIGYLWVRHSQERLLGADFFDQIIAHAQALERPYQIAFDLEFIDSISSEFLSFLIRIKKRTADKGGTFCVVNISERCLTIFTDLNLQAVITLYPTYPEFEQMCQSVLEKYAENCIKLTGDLTVYTIHEFLTPMKYLIYNKGVTDITIDMSIVTIVDSVGIGEIIRFIKILLDKKGTLRIINISKEIYELFQLMKFDRRIQLSLKREH